MSRIDSGEKDLRREVGHSIAIADAARDETLDSLDVLEVEDLEDVGVEAD